jgi:hypothetical protein
MTESEITNAYLKIREIDNTIPDDVLDLMHISAINAIRRSKKVEFTIPVDELFGDLLQLNSSDYSNFTYESDYRTGWYKLRCEYQPSTKFPVKYITVDVPSHYVVLK